jgi:hypothetical protein
MLVCAAGALGCRSLDRFDTKGEASYCGTLVGRPFSAGLSPAGAETRARLSLDTDQLTTLPGALTTSDAEQGLCAPAPLFDQAALRAIPPLMNDALSTLEFGSGRDYNFFAWADSTCQGTMVAVVSLMQDDSVELRLLKPAPASPEGVIPGPEEQPGFGVFELERDSDACNF